MRKKATTTLITLLLISLTSLMAQPCATPSNVIASPAVICPGSSANLNAVSSGNNIDWYTVATGGASIGTSASGANFAVSPVVTTTYYAEANTSTTGSQSFAYTGSIQNFTVPTGVTSVTIDARGAQGGNSNGGKGARMVGTFAVTPGEVLGIVVGQQGIVNNCGGPGASGGGGGGTFVWHLSSTAQPMIAAGGGGGGNTNWNGTCINGIDAVTTNDGTQGSGPTSAVGGTGGNGGYGNAPSGTGSGGGGWLSAGQNSAYGSGCTGGAGAFSFVGGYGSSTFGPGGEGGFGGGGGAVCGCGGGGGYSGGGGGEGASCRAGGGGGGSYNTGTNPSNTAGTQLGNGQVAFTWIGNGCTASLRVPVTVTVDNIAPVANCQPITVQLDSTGNGSALAADVDNGSTDNCMIASLSLSQAVFTCADAGVGGITLTVTDVNGNSSTCAVNVTVLSSALTSFVTADTNGCGYNVSCNNGSDGVAIAAPSGGCTPYSFLWSSGQTTATASGLGAGTYTVTITDAAGQSDIDTIVLLPAPPFQITGTTTPSCPGDSTGEADITPTGGNDCQGYSYLWDNGATVEDPSDLSAGNHTVTVTDAGGCTAIQSFTVGAFPAPVPAFTQSGNTLTSTQPWNTYQWMLNGTDIPGANAMSFVWTVAGNYSLSVTDTNGCTGVSNTTVIVSVDGQLEDWPSLSLFPNPAHGEFKLHSDAPIGYGVTVNVQDMFGKTVYARKLTELGNEASFDIRSLAAGNYVVVAVSEAGQQSHVASLL